MTTTAGKGSANIEYDSEKTMTGMTKVQTQLDAFIDSTNRIVSKFNLVFADLSGESIESYQEVVQQYVEGTKLAEQYIEKLLHLIQTTDVEIVTAEQKSKNMFDREG
ncbi:hypothetical protein K6959_02095 [Bacillus aquiflavi]|uniref:hypothetical protein n=1 Tax=Bacillus aquiflavi TaxID=2672567 RepID=UPI001CA87BA1|nr:hypothetical protein [Bacillus aquiflavi]UAC48784.1 hypothetical protein K6959_02095 [Bacillus aquiflavi]